MGQYTGGLVPLSVQSKGGDIYGLLHIFHAVSDEVQSTPHLFV